jgi:hypothetical protein
MAEAIVGKDSKIVMPHSTPTGDVFPPITGQGIFSILEVTTNQFRQEAEPSFTPPADRLRIWFKGSADRRPKKACDQLAPKSIGGED